ncbi:MAG TPA: TRAP transporter small permease [Candidatus Paceibacterota bacterium]|nr:TRAP transporter small permease [Verrucomicrobiota bacterium]HSA09794.1 TRAP transporter small permease [Candidatus Paceibacterota bacterium]
MSSPPGLSADQKAPLRFYNQALRMLVMALAYLACASLLVMVLVTTAEVVLRMCRLSLTGAYDIVKIAAAITIAAALPYTTAIKGHVAVEYFFHKLGRRGRVVVDALMRLGGMALFGLLAWGCVDYGNSLRARGEVSMTLQLPIFWVPYVLAVSCALVVLIKAYHLTHPGKPMIKP